jgi:hypothetical protein
MSLQAIAAIAAAAHMTMLDRSKFRLGRQASCGDVEAQTDLGSCRGFVPDYRLLQRRRGRSLIRIFDFAL